MACVWMIGLHPWLGTYMMSEHALTDHSFIDCLLLLPLLLSSGKMPQQNLLYLLHDFYAFIQDELRVPVCPCA